MTHEYKEGDRVQFHKQGLQGTTKKMGTVIHVHQNGYVNIDTNNRFVKTKSYPSTVHHSKIIAKI